MQEIIHGDCLEVMKKMPDNSVDSIVTDPPYGISFMGKKWDYDVPKVEVWDEAMRVLKPGGHILVACGTRTQHRMAVNIEDAGFEIRDMIAWVYGSGFPKSLNIGKVMDKYLKTGNASWNGTGDSSNGALGYSKLQHNQGYRPADYSNKHQNKEEITEDLAKKWEGWGTALKPAMELWTLARKPLSEKTVAENVLRWGTGGLNIDESRVGTDDVPINKLEEWSGFGQKERPKYAQTIQQGRFPANLIHDGSDEVVGMFPYSKSGAMKGTYKNTIMQNNAGVRDGKEIHLKQEASSGSAARFMKACMVADDDFFMVELGLCGLTLESQRDAIILRGVRKEAERFTNGVEQFLIGSKPMESFQKDIVSIIKTTTKQMTDLKTLSASLSKNITTFTQESEKTIKLLEGWNTEDAKSAKNIKRLIAFRNELLELIKDTAKTVVEKHYKSGEKKTGSDTTNTTENIGSRIKYTAKASKAERNRGLEGMEEKQTVGGGGGIGDYLSDVNSASGKFGSEKAPAKNNHPTVKPISLMKYLIKLITPKSGTVLDPFVGSGSTAVAAKELGFQCVGIDREEEYCEIARKRLEETQTPII